MNEKHEVDERPVYVPAVKIIMQLKRISAVSIFHIGTKVGNGWFPLCKGIDPASRSEYQYRTTLDRIECRTCLKIYKEISNA